MAKTSLATASSIAASTTSVELLAQNVSRLEDTIANDSTATLYVLEGTGTASSTNFTYLVPPKSDEFGLNYYVASEWLGPVQGAWSAANGAARITRRST
ncbi:MAG: hypothetical protein EON59_00645 [Alphaproteobacteria bacterium]|nr:MAG: hypothetical protein EON59_00645 [Alphaproteobacteria bacterium]